MPSRNTILIMGSFLIVYSAILFVVFQTSACTEQSTTSVPTTPHFSSYLPYNQTFSKPLSGKKLRMLFLTHGYNYDTGMDRFFFNHYNGLKEHPWFEVRMWGIGIDKYNTDLTLRENLVERYGSVYFDVVYIYGMAHNNQIFEISSETITLVREHECWDRRCIPYFRNNGVRLAMFTYGQDMLLYMDLANESLVVHTPQSTDPNIFYHPVDAPRDIGVLIVGRGGNAVYPLREKYFQLSEAGRIPQSYIRKHPGYFTLDWSETFWKHYEQNETLSAQSIAQVHDYAAELKRAKICLFDSSVYKYGYTKYTEVPMTGCMVIADIPHERMDEMKEAIGEVNLEMTDDQIVEVITYWLEHEEERLAKAKRAQEIALKYTVLNWGNTVIDSVNHINTLGYGMVMKHQIELTCTALAVPHGKLKNSYCKR